MSKVVLVSNRLPVTIRESQSGTQTLVPSSGGLVAGLSPVHAEGGVWVGEPGARPSQEILAALESQRLLPVLVSEADRKGHYLGYSNSVLWPLFHYLIESCDFSSASFRAYERVNRQFADAVANAAPGADAIWVHDYQLMLLPEMLRQRLPNALIGFFLHIPFPSAEVFRILPQREELLRGLLGADLIGVHTHDYSGNLAGAVRRVLGLEAREGVIDLGNRKVRIETHAIGVDARGLREKAFSPAAEKRLDSMRQTFRGRKVVLGIDRLDYTKGLPLKLKAYRTLLASSRHLRDRVVLLQVAVPTREGIEKYKSQKDEVERLAGETNGLYGSSDGPLPVRYLYRSISSEELGALYRLAHVAFITPIRDGLNLVAKEYVACRDDATGVLVLSEFAGAASEMGEALRVNPWDIEGTARALGIALEMPPDEQAARMRPLQQRVLANDVQHWARGFLRSLSRPGVRWPESAPVLTAETLAANIAGAFARASTAFLFLDYDGTLREFTSRHDEAVPTLALVERINRMGALPGVSLFILSGRDRKTLETWFRDMPVSLIAEHGAWLRDRGAGSWRRIVEPGPALWKEEVKKVMTSFVQRTPRSLIEEKEFSLAWHYREAGPDVGEWQARDLAAVLEQTMAQSPVEVITGAKVVEVRQQGVSKGNAYRFVRKERPRPDFLLVAGDDRTDEDAFEAARSEAICIHVGTGPTRAGVALDTPAAMRSLLRHLVDSKAPAGQTPARVLSTVTRR